MGLAWVDLNHRNIDSPGLISEDSLKPHSLHRQGIMSESSLVLANGELWASHRATQQPLLQLINGNQYSITGYRIPVGCVMGNAWHRASCTESVGLWVFGWRSVCDLVNHGGPQAGGYCVTGYCVSVLGGIASHTVRTVCHLWLPPRWEGLLQLPPVFLHTCRPPTFTWSHDLTSDSGKYDSSTALSSLLPSIFFSHSKETKEGADWKCSVPNSYSNTKWKHQLLRLGANCGGDQDWLSHFLLVFFSAPLYLTILFSILRERPRSWIEMETIFILISCSNMEI